MIITTLLLPLGHIPFSLPLALETIIEFENFAYRTHMAFCYSIYAIASG